MMKRFLSGFRALFSRRRDDAELESELQSYVETAAAEKQRCGMRREAALRAARIELGAREAIKEDVRSVGWESLFDMLARDVRYALRNLRRTPSFTFVALAALTIGIGANTAVFTVVNGVLLRPMPFPQPDRLLLVAYQPANAPFVRQPSMDDEHYLSYLGRQHSFENVTTFAWGDATLTGAGEPARIGHSAVTTAFFHVLGVTPAVGRGFASEDDQPGRDHIVLLSDALWAERFQRNPAALGKTISLDGVPHTIVGVMPAGFDFPPETRMWTPMRVVFNPHQSTMRPVLGRLRPGVTAQQAKAELEGIARSFKPARWRPQIVPLKELLVSDVRKSLWIFAGAVAFVLLIACANVANLLLMRATARQHEMAVRAALGAGRSRLLRQLLTESTVLALSGGCGGLVLAAWAVPALIALAPAGQIPRVSEVHTDGMVLLFTLAVALITGLLFGLAPALHATRNDLRTAMSQASPTFAGRQRLRSVLVVGEIALTLVLLTGAGLMIKSFVRLRSVDPGFRADHILTMTVDLPDVENTARLAAGQSPVASDDTSLRMRAFHATMLEKLAALPGVQSAAAVNWRPLGTFLIQGDFVLEDRRPLPPGYSVDKMVVSPNYFHALGIPLVRGRDFTDHDTATSQGVVIMTRSAAQVLWPGEDPLGKRISMEDKPTDGDWLTVIGIVDDLRQQSLKDKPEPASYQPIAQVSQSFFVGHMTYIVRTSGDPAALGSSMRNVLHQLDPNLPVQDLATMQELVAGTTNEPLFQARLLGGFSFLALVLAAIGIYGVMAYAVSERTHEIGIRMALGARTVHVVSMVMNRALSMAGAGIALGAIGAFFATRVLTRFLFEVKPTDQGTFIAVALLLAAVAVLAGWMPARRASRVDPMVALRYE